MSNWQTFTSKHINFLVIILSTDILLNFTRYVTTLEKSNYHYKGRKKCIVTEAQITQNIYNNNPRNLVAKHVMMR